MPNYGQPEIVSNLSSELDENIMAGTDRNTSSDADITDETTKDTAARALNQFSAICSSKIDQKEWGKTVLTFDWSAGRIVRVEVQDTTTTKPIPPASNGG